MKLVVDTNILFSFFWSDSFTKKLIKNSKCELISSVVALEELLKYKLDIIKKARITQEQFSTFLKDLKSQVKFFDTTEYTYFLNKSKGLSPDKNDADFFALSLKFNCPLWSNNSFLKSQKEIKIISTKELINILL